MCDFFLIEITLQINEVNKKVFEKNVQSITVKKRYQADQ